MAECCGNGNRLVYSCSGGADVGEIPDRVACLLVKKERQFPLIQNNQKHLMHLVLADLVRRMIL